MKLASALLFTAVCWAQGAQDPAPAAVAQSLFNAMKTHDATAAASLFLPGATLFAVDAAGKTSVTPFEKFVDRIGNDKQTLLERMWKPKVVQQGAIATVWADYDFHLDGKFTHCGIDSFQMLKTPTGWRIAAISFTRITQGCKPNPAGPPKP